jgi:hypothetical protein
MGVWKLCKKKKYLVVGAWLRTGKICCCVWWNAEDKPSRVLLAQGRGKPPFLLTSK